jgi:hypothetical protein
MAVKVLLVIYWHAFLLLVQARALPHASEEASPDGRLP